MVVTDLLAFRQAKEKEEKEAKRNARFRFLGSRCHTAWYHDHDCCKCFDPIMGGMSYVREVYATARGIQVRKHHWPVCPGDDYRRMQEEEERERQAAEAARQRAA